MGELWIVEVEVGSLFGIIILLSWFGVILRFRLSWRGGGRGTLRWRKGANKKRVCKARITKD